VPTFIFEIDEPAVQSVEITEAPVADQQPVLRTEFHAEYLEAD